MFILKKVAQLTLQDNHFPLVQPIYFLCDHDKNLDFVPYLPQMLH